MSFVAPVYHGPINIRYRELNSFVTRLFHSEYAECKSSFKCAIQDSGQSAGGVLHLPPPVEGEYTYDNNNSIVFN